MDKYRLSKNKRTILDENQGIAEFYEGFEEKAKKVCALLNAIDKPKLSDKEYIRVSHHMIIDGMTYPMKEICYERGRETSAFTLEDLARIIYMYEKMYFDGATYADEILPEAEKKLPKRNGETAQSLFEKYWINTEKTAEEEFNKMNQAEKDSIFPGLNDYLLHEAYCQCRFFQLSAMPVKQAFLYWFFKYVEHESYQEITDDLNAIPEMIKDMVDNKLIKKEK